MRHRRLISQSIRERSQPIPPAPKPLPCDSYGVQNWRTLQARAQIMSRKNAFVQQKRKIKPHVMPQDRRPAQQRQHRRKLLSKRRLTLAHRLRDPRQHRDPGSDSPPRIDELRILGGFLPIVIAHDPDFDDPIPIRRARTVVSTSMHAIGTENSGCMRENRMTDIASVLVAPPIPFTIALTTSARPRSWSQTQYCRCSPLASGRRSFHAAARFVRQQRISAWEGQLPA